MNDEKAFDCMFNKAAAALVMVCEQDKQIDELKEQVAQLRARVVLKDMRIRELEIKLPENTDTQEATE